MENHDGTIVAESSYLLVHVVTRKLKKGTACNQHRPHSLLDWKMPGEFYYENMPKLLNAAQAIIGKTSLIKQEILPKQTAPSLI